jgi:protein SCO1
LTREYRVTYGYDKPDDKGNYAVSHSSAVYVFNRKGEARLLIRPTDKMDAIKHDLKRLVEKDA